MQDSQEKTSNFIPLEEVAEKLEISERTVLRWVRNGELRAFKLGNITRIRREDFGVFLEKHMNFGQKHEQV